uniref:ATP synthase subunit a n=1 Tax=Gefionella okellyi TaxID=2853422 RepID=A0A0B5GSJ2_9EUKA|nr:ATP synthase F0 subunit a [Gefionella okellyi]
MISNPLEQFQIYVLIPFVLANYNFSITNVTLFIIIVITYIIFYYRLSILNSTIISVTGWQTTVEQLFEFIYNLAKENITGKFSENFFPFLFVLFNFILMSNLIGMIPYSFTITSHISITFALSFTIFIAIIIIMFKYHKLVAFITFLPSGTPIPLIPFLVPIELISFFSKPFSLSIRLFANMMAGHSLLKILAGFSWSMLSFGGIFYILFVVPLIIVFLITGLEMGIALLQAYVFTILVAMYFRDSIYLH